MVKREIDLVAVQCSVVVMQVDVEARINMNDSRIYNDVLVLVDVDVDCTSVTTALPEELWSGVGEWVTSLRSISPGDDLMGRAS